MLASLVLSFVVSHAQADCPLGAEFVRGIDNLLGACAIAATNDGWLVAVPDTLPSTESSQLRRLASDSVTTVECNALEVRDIAVAADGSVAVADALGVVHVQDAAGVDRVVGKGVLEEPSGVCWMVHHGARALAVSDRRLRAVVIFDDAGTQTHRIGDGVLRDPRGLAAAHDGTLYVADRLADCVWMFAANAIDAADGTGALPIAPRKIGESGANPGQFSAPCDIAIREKEGARCVFVAEELNHRVQILDGSGASLGFFGMHALIPRLGEGRIHYPRSVALNADGTEIAVAEAFEDRVQIFTLSSTPTPPEVTSGSDLISSHFGAEVACDNEMLAVLDVETEAVAVLDARVTPPIHMSIMGGGGASPNRFVEVSAIAIEPAASTGAPTPPRVWIADRGLDRIDVFEVAWDRSQNPIVNMFMPKLVRTIDLVLAAQRFTVPSTRYALRTCDITDIAFAPSDPSRVYLLDSANLALITTDSRLSAGSVELLPTGACSAVELAVASDGRIAISDPSARAVYMRARDGAWSTLTALGEHAFVRPSGVGFATTGALVVSDSARDACVVANPDGSARLVGERGILDEQFWDPQAITTAPHGLLVIDRGNHRYQRFGDGFTWNLTGSLGRYYDRKRRGSPGTTAPNAPVTAPANAPVNAPAKAPAAKGDAS